MVRLEEVSTTSVSGRIFQTQMTGPSAVDFPGDAAEAGMLMTTIAALARSAMPARDFVNADRTRPFAGPDQTPAPPPAENPPAKKTPGGSR
jgi:hypothetical protein